MAAPPSGYSTNYVLDSNYAIKIPTNLDMSASAPLLCAGITTYSPLKYYKLDKPGMKLGVVGLGGLGEPPTVLPALPQSGAWKCSVA